MTHATRPTGSPATSLEYFGSRAGQITSNLESSCQSAFDGLRNTIERMRNTVNPNANTDMSLHVVVDTLRGFLRSISNTAGALSYGLRQEVPFERWFFDHGFQAPLDKPIDQIKARVWAIAAACESLVRTIAEAVSYVFSLVLEPSKTHRHLEVLKVQAQSLGLSALAIISPNWAKQKAYNAGGNSLIGASLLNWKWGSLYTGKVNAPFWKVECRCYPWIELPGAP